MPNPLSMGFDPSMEPVPTGGLEALKRQRHAERESFRLSFRFTGFNVVRMKIGIQNSLFSEPLTGRSRVGTAPRKLLNFGHVKVSRVSQSLIPNYPLPHVRG